MENIDKILEKLNSEQLKPVLDTEGAVLVIAGAGSGKTRVLTSRIAYLILEKKVNPENILAITFTNKAAGEMKERLTRFVGDVNSMWVSTIHSMCVRILRRDIAKLGYDKNFTIYDETDKEKVLKRVLETLGIDSEKHLKGVRENISKAKNECLTPEEYKEKNEGFRFASDYAKVYLEYNNELERSNALDFDDLLFKTYELFTKYPEVADYYSDKFKYVHIDEFQDTNKVQFLIAQRLALNNGNIFVVGDDDQSIYGWRGAVIENILNFDEIYRGAKIYKLEQNYRSTKKILQLANCIIANNTGRRQKELWTENSDGARIETYNCADENDEASRTAMQIKNLVARGYDYSDFAVFMRVNAISRAYEQEFMKYGIPYKVFGGFRFFERKEVKDVLAYLKIINNPFDDQSFLRAVSSPKRGIGDKTLTELKEYCVGLGTSLYDGIGFIDGSSISPSAKTKLFNFKMLLDGIKKYAEINPVNKVMEYVIDKTSFLEQFEEKSEENTSKIYNVNELKNTAELFMKDNVGSTLSDYLNSVTLSTDTDEINEGDAVTVATIHAVKGLEYKCVFVGGLDEGIMPINRAGDIDEDLEEERRLMYVAVTRAKERLFLTRANSRYMYGRREYMAQSRFLKEASAILYPNAVGQKTNSTYTENRYERAYDNRYDNRYDKDGFPIETESSGGYNSSYAKSLLEGNKPTVVNSSNNYGVYKSGVKVNHKKFGNGTVIAVHGEGDNITVDVAFKSVGIKKLALKYAPLEIL